MQTSRRAVMFGATALLLPAWQARALTPEEAQVFVSRVTEDLIEIVRGATPGDPRADRFLDLFRRVAALDAIGRFTMGVHWRSMSEGQQQAFLDAFERYASRAYTNRIGEYNGQTLDIIDAQDVGRRGILVRSRLKEPGSEDVAIDWLVSDRTGTPQIIDIVAEGVSLSIAQREEFAGMLERRSNDYDRFIDDLETLG
jgi:phospholipid transport system substrate-binding protein